MSVERALRIKKALYLGEQQDKDNKYYRVADVLSDLKHYCKHNNIDWNSEVDLSEIYYNNEEDDE